MSYSLFSYLDGQFIRVATEAEYAASVEAAKLDGGAGAIQVDGVICYVLEG